MDRRKSLEIIAKSLGGVLSAPVAFSLLSGCTTGQRVGTGSILTADQLQLAGQLAERIIPATDTPGALAAGVDSFIDMTLSRFFSGAEREVYLRGLVEVNRRARSLFMNDFVACTAEQQDRIVAELDRLSYGGSGQANDPLGQFFRFHKEMTLAGYYTSEIGQMQELHIAPLGSFEADLPYASIGKAWA